MVPIARAMLVFSFMTLITWQAASGFLYELTGLRPRAVVVFDGLLHSLFFEPFGTPVAVFVLTLLSFVLAWLAYRRGAQTGSMWG